MSTLTLALASLSTLALLPLPLHPRALAPLHPCPPLPVSPLPLVAAVDDDRYRHRQQSPSILRPVDDNDHQNSLDVISHQGQQLRSSLSAAAVNGCGSNGIFAAAVSAQLTTRTTRIHWTSFLIEGSNGGHRCLQRRLMAATAMASLPLQSTTTISAYQWLHPTATSVNDDHCQ